MLEYWILWGCVMVELLIGLVNNSCWKRDYAALLQKNRAIEQEWSDMVSRHDWDWSQKCSRLLVENALLREQLRKEGQRYDEPQT